MPHDDGINDGIALESELILMQLADPTVRGDRDIAGSRSQAAIQNFHKGGFATAISADQAIAIAITKFDGNIFEKGFCTKLHGDVGSSNHGNILAGQLKKWTN